MNNIDILEEFLDHYSFLKTAIGSGDIRQFEIKISKNDIKAISNLISENKELKEDNRVLERRLRNSNNRYKKLNDNFQRCQIKTTDIVNSKYISKSKVEEILNKYKYTEIGDNEKIIQFYKELQSLLGKE